jgi:hypothetical protein
MVVGLYHPLDGVTNLKYNLLYFLTPNKKNFKEKKAIAFNRDRCCHLAICLQFILSHCPLLCLIYPSIFYEFAQQEHNDKVVTFNAVRIMPRS